MECNLVLFFKQLCLLGEMSTEAEEKEEVRGKDDYFTRHNHVPSKCILNYMTHAHLINEAHSLSIGTSDLPCPPAFSLATLNWLPQ